MTDNVEHPKGKMDIFTIGLYALEAGIIVAILYGMYVIPMYLKPAPIS
jgi:hypothetical protein